MASDSREQRILFPWERRRLMRRWLGLGRLRPFMILGALVGFFVLVGIHERRAAGERQTRATLIAARRAVEAYMSAHDGGCPEDMAAAARYARLERVPVDAWGRELRLICPGRFDDAPYELMSDGPDGEPGGLDRIE